MHASGSNAVTVVAVRVLSHPRAAPVTLDTKVSYAKQTQMNAFELGSVLHRQWTNVKIPWGPTFARAAWRAVVQILIVTGVVLTAGA